MSAQLALASTPPISLRGATFLLDDHGDQVLVVPYGPKATCTDSDPCGASLSPPQAGAEDGSPPCSCMVTCPCRSAVRWPPRAVPGALGLAALFHDDLMQGAPVCRPRECRAVGGRLAV